ncbi:hypothetical protein EPO04_03425 [Patescibacteria group bacterium]|nr:MAG: hypothetical protein EPO04_03425 [Patescibacteria group bacterium]
MKTFIAYRHTGEDPAALEKLLGSVRSAFDQAGVSAYATFFDETVFQAKSMGAKEIMSHAFAVINESDFLFVIQSSDSKSEGLLMEVGYCLAKGIPVVVATHQNVKHTYLPEMATLSISWVGPQDLISKIAEVDFSKLKF